MTNVEERTLNWVKRVVVGLNLCPFANAVIKADNLAIHTESSDDIATVLESLVSHCESLMQGSEEATVLMVLANGFTEFENYLDLVDLARSLMSELHFEGHLQVATFHPRYQFEDTSFDDAANFTNRSPYPMLHLLNEVAVEKVVKAHPDTEAIPQRNIALLRGMEPEQLSALIGDESKPNEK